MSTIPHILLKTTLGCLMSLLLASGVSQASPTPNMSSESFSFDTPSTQLPSSTTFVSSGSVPEFNPALGTLLGVGLTLAVADTPVIDIYNFGASSPFNFASYGSELAVTSNGNTSTSSSPMYTLNSNGTVGSGLTQFVGPSEFEMSQMAAAAGTLSSYEGLGNVPITVTFADTVPDDLGSGADPGVYFGGETDASSVFTVEYFYEAIPEPSTWALLALTLGGFGIWRLARARRAAAQS